MIIIRIIIYVLNVVPGKRLSQSPDNKREYGTSEKSLLIISFTVKKTLS